MRFTRTLSVALLTLGLAAAPAAAGSSPSPSASEGTQAPTRAGTSFRTATEIDQGQTATADASSGDYLYWSFPADTGQRPTVHATVKLPASHTDETWQLDVYDGLRRRQACQYGAQTRTSPQGSPSVELTCVLRTVRAWSEPWADDPLPGTYYVRLTALNLATADLGLPVHAEVRADSVDMGGAAAVDGSLAKPLVPGIAAKSPSHEDTSGSSRGDIGKPAVLSAIEPDDGWSSGWWTDRWVWTAIGAALAALAGIGGYTLTRGSSRPSYTPPNV
ncbi:hypothetical protein [Streptomyces sp. V3I7]|uniref:hypothetical protein n=1 Tax=Streptomyces sp. V3I7 TaxID=3042278 RepID=UPI00278579EF|nr:hypothetical protein [Streptomyces sp. V3I7]MDQ0993813.1 hypothetical protein [Streptomyces sp. V3I7]